MSLPWHDEIAILVAPTMIALVKRTRRLWRRAQHAVAIPVAEGATGKPELALARLAHERTDPVWRSATAHVVIADAWVRYALVPSPTGRLDPAGRLAHARYILADSFGADVADWVVAVGDAPPSVPYLACAIPPALVQGVQDVLSAAKIVLHSLQPQMVVGFNAHRHSLPAGDSWFVSANGESLAAVHVRDGVCTQVYSVRVSSDVGLELERLRALAMLNVADGSETRLFVDAPPWVRDLGQQDSSALEWLAGSETVSQPHEISVLDGVCA